MSDATKAGLWQLQKQGFRMVGRYAGPPGSGKTTKARKQADGLRAAGRTVYVFEGDEATEVWAQKVAS